MSLSGLSGLGGLSSLTGPVGPYVYDTFVDAGAPLILPLHIPNAAQGAVESGYGWHSIFGSQTNINVSGSAVISSPAAWYAGNIGGAYIESGHSDGVITATLNYLNTNTPFIAIFFRRVDNDNFWAAGSNIQASPPNQMELYRVVNQVITKMGGVVLTTPISHPGTYDITITLSGSSITTAIGSDSISVTDSTHQTATHVGWYGSDINMSISSFKMKSS
jgi:hypothetical protein